jgi:GT2 family glycosyltransferase
MPPAFATLEFSVAVSIIIVNWNTRTMLRNCLLSVVTQTRVPHQIIVVDNASSDASAAMVRGEFPDVMLIANPDNRGFAGANNQGLRVATGRTVLLLNPDTIVLDGAIDRMMAWLDRNPDVGCVGCQVLEGPDVIQRTCFADPSPANQMIVELGLMRLARWIPAFGRPWYADWDRRSARDVDVVSGMFMLVPRAVIQRVGLLDDAFLIYAEEADWCRRIRKAGWRCVFAPEAQILHLDGGSKSTAQVRSKMHVQMQKSHLIYARKHHGAAGYAATKSLYVLSALLRGALFGPLAWLRGDPTNRARLRLAGASLRFHLAGQEPAT